MDGMNLIVNFESSFPGSLDRPVGCLISFINSCRRFETQWSLSRRVNVAACPSPDGSRREGEREGGRSEAAGDRRERGGNPAAFVFVPPQVGCACSRGLQASTRERERAAPSERLFLSLSPRGQPSLRGPWSFLL
jgi:hypothetical protein